MNTLAERIAEAMEKSGVSITDVANACGISYQAVRKWLLGETHRLDGQHLIALAELTGYDPKWIISGQGPKIRLYAKTQAQTQTLIAMQKMPEGEQHKVPEIAYLLGHQPEKAGNGWQ